MDKINQKIDQLLLEKSQNEVVGERLNYLDQKINKLELKESAYSHRAESEKADVTRLESMGLLSLFNKVLGSLEEKLQKEREEYLKAVLDHKSVIEEIELIKYELEILKKRYKEPKRINEELSKALKEKESKLKSYDTGFTKELFKRESEMGRYKLVNQKTKKSIDIADKAIAVIKEIKTELKEVKDWPPSGKSNQSSYRKKKYIDRARAKAIRAKVRLEEFVESTSRLFSEIKVEFDLKPFEFFLDVFYENLITDYKVRHHLTSTMNSLTSTEMDLLAAKEILNNEFSSKADLLTAKEQELKAFVLSYKSKKGA